MSSRLSPHLSRLSFVILGASLLFHARGLQADSPHSAEFRLLRLEPTRITLNGFNRLQQVRVLAETETGATHDVTHRSLLAIDESALARVNAGLIRAKKSGRTRIVARLGSLQASAPLTITAVESYAPVNFETDIVPVFSKRGCNSGGCHGKQAGQNGFKLSVFGFDPRADFAALVKEGRGRRVFPADPSRSLLVSKATGRVPHGGGQRCPPDSEDAILLEEWVRQGLPWGAESVGKLKAIEISPEDVVLGMNSQLQVLVTAVFSDGRRRDVTTAAAYSGNADSVAVVNDSGHVRSGATPGEAAITINYMGQVAAARVIVPRASSANAKPLAVRNRIDELVRAKLLRMGIQPSSTSSDAAFFRRLHLDVLGVLPTANEASEFLTSNAADKRTRAIADVLERPEYADYWALKWSDVLLVDRDKLGDRGAYQFHQWLRTQFVENRAYDEWVRDLILASGNSGKHGPVNFYRALRTPEELTKSVSQAFLGIRMDCAQCHHHPFEKWSQQDFYGMAGFFHGVKRVALPSKREVVYHTGVALSRLPLTQEVIPTRPPDGPALPKPFDGDPRRKLAAWMTQKDNRWFARVAVNRLWKHFLGRGLVEPEDDLRTTNPATNEPLLTYLAEEFVRVDYDLKKIIQQIVESEVYQLSSRPIDSNQDDEQNFSHYYTKRMPAEVLLDAISRVTGSPEQFPGAPKGVRAVQLWDNRLPSYFLDTFGRSERESPCECAKSSDPTMAQALHLMNAPEIEAKITSPGGRVAKLVEAKASRDAIVEDLCLAALGRPPGEKERYSAAKLFDNRPVRKAAEDFLWTLLNSYEFLFIQ